MHRRLEGVDGRVFSLTNPHMMCGLGHESRTTNVTMMCGLGHESRTTNVCFMFYFFSFLFDDHGLSTSLNHG
jgi:hypothetical protein